MKLTKIRDGAVSKIPTQNGDRQAIPTNSVGTNELRDLSVTSSKLAENGTFMASANYTVGSNIGIILCDSTGGDFNVTLPSAVAEAGRRIMVKKISADSNGAFLLTVGGQFIDQAGSGGTKLEVLNDGVTIVSDGTNWQVVARYYQQVNGIRYMAVTQSFPNAVNTRVSYNGAQARYMTPTGTFSLQITYKAYYSITGNMRWLPNNAGTRRFTIVINGVEMNGVSQLGTQDGGDCIQSVTIGQILLQPGDIVEGWAYQNSGGALSLHETPPQGNSFTINRIFSADDA